MQEKNKNLINKILKLLKGLTIAEARTLLMDIERKIENEQKIIVS